MDFLPRLAEKELLSWLNIGKVLIITGARQVGKTTLALGLLGEDADERHPAYLNWDDLRMRPRIRGAELPPDQPLLIFDEIHKYRAWRGLLKGLYDKRSKDQRILVTGSARLDLYRLVHGGYTKAFRHKKTCSSFRSKKSNWMGWRRGFRCSRHTTVCRDRSSTTQIAGAAHGNRIKGRHV
jgi:hypothetical protein